MPWVDTGESSRSTNLMPVENADVLRRRIRLLVAIVFVGLVFSGLTAIPLETEIRFASELLEMQWLSWVPDPFVNWIERVRTGLEETNAEYRFMAYGTDWLAFGHFVIAIAFIGPWRDPVRNIWVIEFALIASVLVIPFALIMGEVRGIPMFWRFIDCCFGIGGFIPLWWCRKLIQRLEGIQPAARSSSE